MIIVIVEEDVWLNINYNIEVLDCNIMIINFDYIRIDFKYIL